MTEKNALIGNSGFVGGNILSQQSFSELYNSKNITEIKGKTFDTVVCSGAPAAKWIANKEPEKDMDNIQNLISCLGEVQARQFVLISTIDVYKTPLEVDESTPVVTEGLHAYGSNRYILEQFVNERFENKTILRLPGLFGLGLKKNVIYDFLNKNNIDKIESRGVFQFYNLEHLSKDIKIAQENNISLLNLSTEPISVSELVKHCFHIDFNQELPGVPARYDFRTIHANAFGKSGSYLYNKEEVLSDMKKFVDGNK